MDEQRKPFYDFGPYRLDPVKRLLLKDGGAVALTPKAFDTLLVLVEESGQVLEKEELIRRVWPDSFVEEGNLTVNISMLRKVLGESPNQHRYIVTVPGKGYRFVASVRELWDENAELVVEERTRGHVIIEHEEGEPAELGEGISAVPRVAPALRAVTGLPHLRTRWMLLATGTLLFCLTAIGVLFWPFARPSMPEEKDWRASLQFIRLAGLKSDRKESMNNGRLSPDGSFVVFSATGEGLNLWIRQIGGGQPLQITKGPYNDDSPVWSPKGQRIAFISDRNNQVGIWMIPSLGNTEPVLLKTLETSATSLKGGTAVRHWSKNGETIYFSWSNNVYELNVATKETVQLTNFDPEPLFNREFRISQDEEWIAYVDKKGEQFDIWRVPIRGGAPVQVTNDRMREHRPVWHTDGKRIIYSARLDGRFRLYQVYLDGRPPELITFTEDESYIWDISYDGTKLLYYGSRDESDLWQINIGSKEEAQLTSDIGLEFWPQVSPNGGAIAFHALRGENIVWEPKRSSLLVETVASRGQAIEVAEKASEMQWSPDGGKIAFLREAAGISNLFSVGAAGGEEKELTTGGVIFHGSTIGPPFNLFCAKDFCWSPDGNRIAYCSRKDGAPNLWIVDADGSNETKVSSNADSSVDFSCPIWSPDGTHIAYMTNTGERPREEKQSWSLYVTDLKKADFVFRTESVLRLLGWTSPGNEVAVAMVDNQGMSKAFPAEVSLSRILIAGRAVEDIGRIESAYLANFHLSPGGRNVSYVSSYDGKDNIWVLPVSGGERKKITSNPDSKSYYSGLAWSPDGKHIYYGKQASWNLIMLIDNFR